MIVSVVAVGSNGAGTSVQLFPVDAHSRSGESNSNGRIPMGLELAIALATVVLMTAVAFAGSIATSLKKSRQLQSPEPWRKTAADPMVGATGGLFIVLLAAYAGYLFYGIIVLCSVLMCGWTMGIFAHYWVYSRAGQGERQSRK